jgi:hypothetical protein
MRQYAYSMLLQSKSKPTLMMYWYNVKKKHDERHAHDLGNMHGSNKKDFVFQELMGTTMAIRNGKLRLTDLHICMASGISSLQNMQPVQMHAARCSLTLADSPFMRVCPFSSFTSAVSSYSSSRGLHSTLNQQHQEVHEAPTAFHNSLCRLNAALA